VAEAAITVDGLTKRFGELVALDHVSFEVEAGTVFGLLGPNDAGKTTCIRILTTILRPDAGRAAIAGRRCRLRPHGGPGALLAHRSTYPPGRSFGSI